MNEANEPERIEVPIRVSGELFKAGVTITARVWWPAEDPDDIHVWVKAMTINQGDWRDDPVATVMRAAMPNHIADHYEDIWATEIPDEVYAAVERHKLNKIAEYAA